MGLMFVYFVFIRYTVYMLYYCNSAVDLVGLKPHP